MTDSYILSLDQGTTSTRALLFDAAGHVLATEQVELTLHYPEKGWVEQDPRDLWRDSRQVLETLLDKNADKAKAILAMGITNQRETTIVWDRKTGEAIYNAIVWQDRRTAAYCQSLKDKGLEESISQKTGLLLDPYFSATKINWILENVKGARARAEKGELAFGTVDSFILFHLTGGKVHATDATNASRTLLYNICENKWDAELCKLFGVPQSMLPEVKDCVADFGTTIKLSGRYAFEVKGIAGDQQAALVGQACIRPGMIKSTYGTGCFALMNTGAECKQSKNRMLSTIAYRINGETTYAIEGAIFVAGAAIQWLRDGLGIFKAAPESEALARSVNDTNGVYFVPAFTGLGAPHWEPEARALITGLTRDSTAAHITRAALEAQAYQTYDLLGAMADDTGQTPEVLRVDGGLVQNHLVCQILADILNLPIEVPESTETTARGAAFLAGIGAGLYKGLDDLDRFWKADRSYGPSMSAATRKTMLKGWESALAKTLLK